MARAPLITPKPNTLNQRNSRARRQEHVASLEARIRYLEAEGLEVAREMQVAARRVAEENRLLRDVLERRFGVGRGEVEGLLRQERIPGDGAYQQTKTIWSVQREFGHRDLSPNVEVGEGHKEVMMSPASQQSLDNTSTTKTSDEPSPFQTSSSYASTLWTPKPSSTTECCSADHKPVLHNLTSTPPQEFNQQDAPQHYQPSTTNTTANSMPCDEAARIIASMRTATTPHAIDPVSIWPELGCSENDSCRVPSLRIFEMMDG